MGKEEKTAKKRTMGENILLAAVLIGGGICGILLLLQETDYRTKLSKIATSQGYRIILDGEEIPLEDIDLKSHKYKAISANDIDKTITLVTINEEAGL